MNDRFGIRLRRRFVVVLLGVVLGAGLSGCDPEVNERLDPTEFRDECDVDAECSVYTTACPNADCQCPDFAARRSERQAVATARANLDCPEPPQGTQCDCAVFEAACVEGRCTGGANERDAGT